MAVDIRATIRAAARQYGVPEGLLLAQLKQESGLRVDALGPPVKGGRAIGIAQFMPATARGMGVNPRDPVSSIYGAARLDAQNYAKYHKWGLALAAYNAGGGAVDKYHGIPPYGETRNYVRSILAAAGTGEPATAAAGPVPGPPSGPAAVGPPQGLTPDVIRHLTLISQANTRDVQAGRTPAMGRFQEMARLIAPALARYTAPGPAGQVAGMVSGATGAVGTGVLGATYKLIGTPHSGTHTLGNWQSDDAVDLRVPIGTPVYALESGVIDPKIGALSSTNPRFAGQRLTLHGSDNSFYYAHLSRLAVRAGQRVKKGQLLGYSGAANGVPHLHLGVQYGDPRKYLG